MLIDKYLPYFQFSERHSIAVNAAADNLLKTAVHYNTQDDIFYKIAIMLRELPNRILHKNKNQTVKPFSMEQFTCLESSNEEVVFGLLGRFWRLDYGLNLCKNAEDFLSFNQATSAKLVLNFHVTSLSNHKTLLSTETRIFCTDKSSLHNFSYYWYLIRPISGIIRLRMLKAIAKKSMESFENLL